MSENHVSHGRFALVMLTLFAVAASIKYGGNMTATLSASISGISRNSSSQGMYIEPTDEKAVLLKAQEATQVLADKPTIQDYEKPQEFRIEARNWQFSPSMIAFHQGRKTFLDFIGIDRQYSVVIPALHINLLIPKAGTSSVLIPTTQAGTYPFRCQMCENLRPPHLGMEGTITIQSEPQTLTKENL